VKLSDRLFADPEERDAFVHSLVHPAASNPCILWCQEKPQDSPFELEPPLDWQPGFVDRLVAGQKPGQHPLHQQGAFYCLDFSSVFAIAPLLTLSPGVDLVVDVCASPGGKSIFAWVALQPRLLISNEVIGKRMAALISNLKRCHISPAIATNLDSKILAQEIPKTAPVVLVDAPCSGQSLLAKGDKAPGCFHPVTINGNANRQKRILANSAQLVAPGGYLVYMTCTYSPEENEQVAAWLMQRLPQFQAIAVPPLATYQSHLAEFPCYRMFPQSNPGAGAFTVLLQNTETGEKQVIPEAFSGVREIFSNASTGRRG
jgi:16S rRNA C967 or C1407 C5-methylase (RsmB/RsmF family)